YDAHEIYSSMVEREIGWLSHLVWLLERRLSREADEIVTVNESLAARLSEGRAKPARIVTNSPDTGIIDGLDVRQVRDRYGLRGFVISYLGSLEPGRFVKEMLSSMEPGTGVTLAIGGEGTLRPVVEKAAASNSRIKFLGTIDTDEALRVTYASDLVVAMLDPNNPNYRSSTPVKVLDAMACGRPVVVSEGLEISNLLRRIGCAFVIPYDRQAFKDALALAQADPKLLATMGRKGKEYFEKELSWPRSRDELLKAYKALVRGA
ncbi:MAG: glycosyltransferase, partial [Thermoplasmata archaeon]